MTTSVFFFHDPTPAVEPVIRAEIPRSITTKAALLDELYRRLHLPDYFGNNWDALNECIRDFSWLPPGPVMLKHEELPLASDTANLKIYLSILRNAVQTLSRSGKRELVVVFPRESREEIAFLLKCGT